MTTAIRKASTTTARMSCSARVIALSALVVGCTGASPVKRDSEQDRLIESRCNGLAIPVRYGQSDSISSSQSCALLRRAIASLGRVDTANGVAPADTAAISRALVTAMTEESPEGVVLHERWHVSLELDARPYDVEVTIDRQSDEIVVT